MQSTRKSGRRRNESFTFKQFHIDQSGCGMKVSSDACIFGAYIPVSRVRRILDIGTGTGLLALMLAQRVDETTEIAAVEIDPAAAAMAKKNVLASPFAALIQVYQSAIQHWQPPNQDAFDLIVANPPFYQNSLQSEDYHRNIAWHGGRHGLDFDDLTLAVSRLLAPEGRFWVLLPSQVADGFMGLANAKDLCEVERLSLRPKPNAAVHRVISCFSRRPAETTLRELVRTDEEGEVSEEERTLLADYMLHFPSPNPPRPR
jgi:tRNA1Val (adenine37-N6)-methyltransferase